MIRLTLLAALPLLWSCTGPDTGTWVAPENCTNGIDDNGNGLVDCLDTDFCGGPACLQVNTGDTGDNVSPIRVDFTDGDCDFLYSEADCTKLVCSVPVINDTEEDGFITANCVNPIQRDYENIILFRNVQQNTGRLSALSNSVIDAKSTAMVELHYDCFMPTSYAKFTAECTIKGDADNRFDTENFQVEGINTNPK